MKYLFLLLLLPGCANYNVGDISARYCGTAAPEIRATLKIALGVSGVDVGLDYCATVGLIDVLLEAQNVN
mgnify:CR=1 FL=1